MPQAVAKSAPNPAAAVPPAARPQPKGSDGGGFSESLARRVGESEQVGAHNPVDTSAESAPESVETPKAEAEAIDADTPEVASEGEQVAVDEPDAAKEAEPATDGDEPDEGDAAPVTSAVELPAEAPVNTGVIAQGEALVEDVLPVENASAVKDAPKLGAEPGAGERANASETRPARPTTSTPLTAGESVKAADTASEPVTETAVNAGPAAQVAEHAADAAPNDQSESTQKERTAQSETVAASSVKQTAPEAKAPAGESASASTNAAVSDGASSQSETASDHEGGEEQPRPQTSARVEGASDEAAAGTEPASFPEAVKSAPSTPAVETLAEARRAENARQDAGASRPAPQAVDAPSPAQQDAPRPVSARAPQPPAPSGPGGEAADQPRSLEQATQRTMLASVQRGLSAAMAQRGGEMTIRLAPESLGAMRISMTIAQGTVTASFTPETAEAARLLRGGLDSLRESIESRGLQVDRLRVAAHTTQTTAEAGGSRSEQNTSRQDDARPDSGEGRSRGRGDHPEGRQQRERGGEQHSRFQQQWRLALDATA